MFKFLTRYLPRPAAGAIMALWYAMLLWAIFFCLRAPNANFRYWWI